MFLRNLPRGSTEDDIIATFGRYGRIDYVHMPPNVTTFANISFVSLEEVDACMAARPHQVSIGGSRYGLNFNYFVLDEWESSYCSAIYAKGLST